MSQHISTKNDRSSPVLEVQELTSNTVAKSSGNQPAHPMGSKTICIHFERESYHELLLDTVNYRKYIEEQYAAHPELFPVAMGEGFDFHDMRPPSKKLGIQIRRIKLKATGQVFSVAPSFIMPYMVAFTEDVANALFLLNFGVPFWALTHAFGRNDMYWYRLVTSIGRNSIVGTTVKTPESLPKDLVADEKHTTLQGGKAYIATTAGGDCVLGAAICEGADTKELTQGYGVFAEEASNVDPNYQPQTVNVDGWQATTLAWLSLFPKIAIIACFLHAFLKIRDRAKRLGSLFVEISKLVWDAYHAENKRAFSQRLRRLREWAQTHLEPGVVQDKVLALCEKASFFAQAYDHPDAHRTSNLVDRLMRWQDRFLFNRQYFHGSLEAAQLNIRAWAILHNFRPYSPRAIGKETDGTCPAERLNGFRYSDNWLENLRISSSMGGYRQ